MKRNRRIFFKRESLTYEPIDKDDVLEIDSKIDFVYEVISEYKIDKNQYDFWIE